jgi:hypothetical protein
MFKFWYDAAMLSLEAQRVVGLRMMKIAGGGPGAHAEASRMVTEKIAASLTAATTLMCGGSGHAVVAQVRKRVRSNSRRLSR